MIEAAHYLAVTGHPGAAGLGGLLLLALFILGLGLGSSNDGPDD
jgi:hypothetical protein